MTEQNGMLYVFCSDFLVLEVWSVLEGFYSSFSIGEYEADGQVSFAVFAPCPADQVKDDLNALVAQSERQVWFWWSPLVRCRKCSQEVDVLLTEGGVCFMCGVPGVVRAGF